METRTTVSYPPFPPLEFLAVLTLDRDDPRSFKQQIPPQRGDSVSFNDIIRPNNLRHLTSITVPLGITPTSTLGGLLGPQLIKIDRERPGTRTHTHGVCRGTHSTSSLRPRTHRIHRIHNIGQVSLSKSMSSSSSAISVGSVVTNTVAVIFLVIAKLTSPSLFSPCTTPIPSSKLRA